MHCPLSTICQELVPLRASLATPFFQGIPIFPREISSFSLGKIGGKIGIPWENGVAKLALRLCIFHLCTCTKTEL
jgi:hypothetical protein